MMDIPFFGGERWQTMYDWPKQQAETAHMSLGSVWDICLTRDKIVRNNANADDAIAAILSDSCTGLGLGFDPAQAKRFLAPSLPCGRRAGAREPIIAFTLKELDGRGMARAVRLGQGQDPTTLTGDKLLQHEAFMKADRALRRRRPAEP